MVTLDDGSPFDAEHLVRSIAAASPDWIYVFDFNTGGITYANRSILAHLGYSRERRRGVDSLEGLREFMLSEDAPLLDGMLEQWQALRDGEIHEEERRLRHADGTARYFAGREQVFARRNDGSVRLILGILSDVTPRKKVELALRESEERLKRAQAVAHVGSWYLDLKRDNVLTWSDETYRIFGIPPGTPMDYPSFLECVHPDDRRLVDDAWSTALTGADYLVEHRILVAGEIKWVREQAVLERNAAGELLTGVGTVQDITKYKHGEEQLRASEERFRELVENVSECLWIASPDKQEVLYVSPAYEKIWGRKCTSLLERPASWLDAVCSEDRERVRAEWVEQAHGDYDVEFRLERPDGSVRWVHDRAFSVRDRSGNVVRIVGVVTDITDTKAFEEQFRQAQKMEAIGRLAGGVAHDFNNLLTVIGIHAESAQRAKAVPASVREALAQIHDAADRAADLTQQLLMLGRRGVLQLRHLDLNELIRNAAKLLARVIGEDIQLELQLCPEPLSVHADRAMLDQVLLNLAVNARDAMAHGGKLVVETKRVDLRARPNLANGEYVVLRVTDTGTGIPRDVQPRIFEPFFTTKDAGKGSGLGLATVFGIVQQHKGAISLTSEVNCGTTFEVLLPRSATAPEELACPPLQNRARTVNHGETVLLVEDEHHVRTLVHQALDQHGYRVLSASDGLEALRTWRRHANEIDLLITDVVLPRGINGRELARLLRLEKPGLRVLCTSGYPRPHASSALDVADAAFLQKPFSQDQLLRAIDGAVCELHAVVSDQA